MLYITSKLYSLVQFNIKEDPLLWRLLVKEVEEIDEFTWKIRVTTDIFHSDDVQFLAYSQDQGWQPQTDMVVQTAVSYLHVEQADHRTLFTIVSASRDALESLVALLENLYEPVTALGLDDFLQKNSELSIRTVEMFNRGSGNKVRQTYAEAIRLGDVYSEFPTSAWDYRSLVAIPAINEPLKVSELFIKMYSNQAWFAVEKIEPARIDKLFELTEMVFRNNPLAEKVLV